MAEHLDPEVEALLADVQYSARPTMSDDSFDYEDAEISVPISGNGGQAKMDMTKKTFAPIAKFFSDTPHAVFDDPQYYKIALSSEDQTAQKLHALLSKFLTSADPKDRSVYRQQLTMTYWEFLKSVVPKMASLKTAAAKKYLLRYGVVTPTLFTPEQKNFFASVIDENVTGESIYYLDEWFHNIGAGQISLSATDEAKPQRSQGGGGETLRLQQLTAKILGKKQNAENQLGAKEHERGMLEAELKSKVDFLCDHPPLMGLSGHTAAYSEAQRSGMNETVEKLRTLSKIDREILQYINEVTDANEEYQVTQQKIAAVGESGSGDVSSVEILTELGTIRQMAKMTVGRQGNHFPIFTKEYYHCLQKTTGFRENVLQTLAWVESLDPNAFVRVHKRVENRIVPYVVLIPTYGDTGFCWEPFDRYNRITSRGRIIIPMYPKSLQLAVLTATADLRWQVAKEKASYYWMEEGLTGQYYQWFDMQKLKGDVKDYFINDYVLWMTKESEGIQRLCKEVRGIFWRHLPYSQERKDMLKTRSLVYQELCQKDANRSMSDGY